MFETVYVRQTANDLTGEHSCLMIRPLSGQGEVSLPVGMAQGGDWL
jgi:N-acetyltransferase 10